MLVGKSLNFYNYALIYGALAHLVERNNGIVEVNGSTPLRSNPHTRNETANWRSLRCFWSAATWRRFGFGRPVDQVKFNLRVRQCKGKCARLPHSKSSTCFAQYSFW